jgi:hypothetical protein
MTTTRKPYTKKAPVKPVETAPIKLEEIPIPGHNVDTEDIEEEVEYVDIPVATIMDSDLITLPEEIQMEENLETHSPSDYSTVSQLLFDIVKSKNPSTIAEYLTPTQINCLSALFTFNFTTKFTCKLGKGYPPRYNAQVAKYNEKRVSLFNTTDQFAYFIRETYLLSERKYVANLTMAEVILEEWLEQLDPLDGEVVVATKDRELESKYGITLELVEKIFPELIQRF